MIDAKIVERIERLERTHRRLKRIALFALLLPVFGFGYARAARNATANPATSSPTPVTASEFDLVDAQGKSRAKIGFDNSGEPTIELYDEKGQTRARMYLLGQVLRGEPAIELSNAEGRQRIGMFLSGEGSTLSFLGKENSEIDIGLSGLGLPRMTLLDEPGKSELDLGRGMPAQQAGSMQIYDINQHKAIWKVP